MWTVLLNRGLNFSQKEWKHSSRSYALQRANALAFLHATKVEIIEAKQLIQVNASIYYTQEKI